MLGREQGMHGWMRKEWKRMDEPTAAQALCDLLARAHARRSGTGGLYNACEKAVHYELLSEIYADGVWGTRAEVPITARRQGPPPSGDRPRSAVACDRRAPRRRRGERRCDLVIPLIDATELWVEAKIIWFAYTGPHAYWTLDKYKTSPGDDWAKLEMAVERGQRRAVLVLAAWDLGRGGASDAKKWLSHTTAALRSQGARLRGSADLAPFDFPYSGGIQQLRGRVLCWA